MANLMSERLIFSCRDYSLLFSGFFHLPNKGSR